jgi:hypothetical protein
MPLNFLRKPVAPQRITPIDLREYRSYLLTVENYKPASVNWKLSSLSTPVHVAWRPTASWSGHSASASKSSLLGVRISRRVHSARQCCSAWGRWCTKPRLAPLGEMSLLNSGPRYTLRLRSALRNLCTSKYRPRSSLGRSHRLPSMTRSYSYRRLTLNPTPDLYSLLIVEPRDSYHVHCAAGRERTFTRSGMLASTASRMPVSRDASGYGRMRAIVAWVCDLKASSARYSGLPHPSRES